jgi:hypothetical protein
MIARFLARLAARRLSNHGHDLSRERIKAKAAQIRRELGLPPDRRLA